MMISKEQAQAAVNSLKSGMSCSDGSGVSGVSPEVIAAALAVVESTPDTDPRRIASAQDSLAGECANSREVASMMIQRIVSDSLR